MRTIAEMARSILRQKSLSLSFWPYAVMYAYLKNLLPHKAIDFDIPYEKLYNCVGFRQIRCSVAPCGYPEDVRGFYVYLVKQRKMDIVSRLYETDATAGSAVQTESTYKIDPNDSEIFMNPDHSFFSKPLYGDERETVQDNLEERMQ